MKKIYSLFLLSLSTLFFAGCGSNGGGGGILGGILGSSAGSSSVGGSSIVGSSFAGSGAAALPVVVNPEPSTIVLFASGLIGIAVYANARFKRSKK